MLLSFFFGSPFSIRHFLGKAGSFASCLFFAEFFLALALSPGLLGESAFVKEHVLRESSKDSFLNQFDANLKIVQKAAEKGHWREIKNVIEGVESRAQKGCLARSALLTAARFDKAITVQNILDEYSTEVEECLDEAIAYAQQKDYFSVCRSLKYHKKFLGLA